MLRKRAGVAPGLRAEIALRDRAMSGEAVLVCNPATLGSSATVVNAAIASGAAKFVRTVVVTFTDVAGNVHTWFDGTFAAGVAKTGSGACAIAAGATVVTLVKGRGTIGVEYTGAWVATNTFTLTITGSTKLGYSVANKTSVDTLVA